LRHDYGQLRNSMLEPSEIGARASHASLPISRLASWTLSTATYGHLRSPPHCDTGHRPIRQRGRALTT
jgi:hypothetical protein